jgi:putative hydrolase of the HAD superfamily
MSLLMSDNMKAILFDLGGVYFQGGLKDLFQRYPSLSGEGRMELIHMHDDGVLKGRIEPAAFWDRASELAGVDAAEMREGYLRSIHPIEGMPELVKQLSGKYRLGIISGVDSERIDYLDQKYGFLEPFEVRVFSYEMGTNKPDSVMYATAIEKLGLPPEETLFVDDDPRNLEPAKELGMSAIHFESVEKLKKDLASYGIET